MVEEFPKHLYAANGETIVVWDQEEQDARIAEGWQDISLQSIVEAVSEDAPKRRGRKPKAQDLD